MSWNCPPWGVVIAEPLPRLFEPVACALDDFGVVAAARTIARHERDCVQQVIREGDPRVREALRGILDDEEERRRANAG